MHSSVCSKLISLSVFVPVFDEFAADAWFGGTATGLFAVLLSTVAAGTSKADRRTVPELTVRSMTGERTIYLSG
jgi:hypothetical protein